MDAETIRQVLQRADRIHDGAQIDAALDRMADAIRADLADAVPVVLCIMVGGLIPAGRLLPRLDFPLEIDYAHATRYRGETSGGDLVWQARPRTPLAGRSVLIVDDILDEGHTLAGIIDYCRRQGARDVRTAVLVRKEHDRALQEIDAEYVGLTVGDRYVFGAGMDYRGVLRNVDGIYAIGEEQA